MTRGRDSASALCLACGFCCSGLLYATVDLAPDEVEPAHRFRLPVYREGEQARFRQPCVRHEQGACAIYEERPRACAAYECKLLERLRAGELTYDASLERVTLARTLMERIQAMVRLGAHSSFWKALDAYVEAAEQEDASWRTMHPGLLMDIAELRLHFARHFDTRFEPPSPASS